MGISFAILQLYQIHDNKAIIKLQQDDYLSITKTFDYVLTSRLI